MTLLNLPFCVVGTGSVSRAFAHALAKAGLTVSSVVSRSRQSAAAFAEEIERAFQFEIQALELPDADRCPSAVGKCSTEKCAVLVAVPDSALSDHLGKRLASLFPTAEYVIHTSGAVQSSVLSAVSSKSLSFHPCSAFPRQGKVPVSLKCLNIGIEGCSDAVEEEGKKLARLLGARPFGINRNCKGMYHAACCISSNFSWTLMHHSITTLSSCGVDKRTAHAVALSLAERSLEAMKSTNPDDFGDALTGPIVRGDIPSIKLHLEQLERTKDVAKTYRHLAQDTARAAHEYGEIGDDVKNSIFLLTEETRT